MSATNFNTKNDTYRKLMDNGLTYRIPRFQRDYSWGEDEWDELWQDILGTIVKGGEPTHSMDYLVLQSAMESGPNRGVGNADFAAERDCGSHRAPGYYLKRGSTNPWLPQPRRAGFRGG